MIWNNNKKNTKRKKERKNEEKKPMFTLLKFENPITILNQSEVYLIVILI